VIVIGAKRRKDVSLVDQPPSVKGVIVAVLHLFFVLCFLLSKKRRLTMVSCKFVSISRVSASC
jgi:hypothetical protein